MEGTVKAYGDDTLYKVHAVTVIPPLKKLDHREKKHWLKQSSTGFTSQSSFQQALEAACEQEQQKDVRIQVSGYTNKALPMYYFINTHDYN